MRRITSAASLLQPDGANDASDGEGEESEGEEEDREGSEENVSSEERDEVRELQRLMTREALHATLWRRMVVFLFQAVCTIVTAVAYLVLDREVFEQFDSVYHQLATFMKNSVVGNVKSIVEAADGISTVITAHAVSSESQWPRVSLPNFEFYAQHLREQSKAELIVFAPVVLQKDLAVWSLYSQLNQRWINEGYAALGGNRSNADPIPSAIYDDQSTLLNTSDSFLPYWQMSPPPSDPKIINYNSLSVPSGSSIYDVTARLRDATIGPIENNPLFDRYTVPANDGHADTGEDQDVVLPRSTMMYPVFARNNNETVNGKDIVGSVILYLSWQEYLQNILPDAKDEIHCHVVLHNSGKGHEQEFTYLVDGKEAAFVGKGDHHEKAFDEYKFVIDLAPLMKGIQNRVEEEEAGEGAEEPSDEQCAYRFLLYPSERMFDDNDSNVPFAFAFVFSLSSMAVCLSFMTYDSYVQQKSKRIVVTAAQTSAIVSSLFPENIRERLFRNRETATRRQPDSPGFSRSGWKTYLEDGVQASSIKNGQRQIADLFPETTVMFADLVGFTAWSSVREPSAVFTLLETVYHAFDQLAKTRGVFKVETVGDCYVAVAGLPEPRENHAIVMAEFANECLRKTRVLTHSLEVTLGPDTGDLSIRVGLHSGPVTAGVLRGDRARFQLFGDTVNTASRMESTGKSGMIQLSRETAHLLKVAGKEHWVSARDDGVVAKGKGELKTFWLTVKKGTGSSTGSFSAHSISCSEKKEGFKSRAVNDRIAREKLERLIDWNVEVLAGLLRKIVQQRKSSGKNDSFKGGMLDETDVRPLGHTVLDEVKEIITLPDFEKRTQDQQSPESIELSDKAMKQLRGFVRNIAYLYRDNPFHNFEHASHVTMSVIKLLSRIVAPSDLVYDPNKEIASTLHDHTYGITSDPLTQFACVIAALIHDVDHAGVPNAQLIEECPDLAARYKNKSVAEQNSVDISWNLLMEEANSDLRAVIYTTRTEKQRFRQLVVNSVMATDIMDKDLKALRNSRWAKAFTNNNDSNESGSIRDNTNRKATIVIEHVLQASDVAHTMQHWHVYRKWNERLFLENNLAYHQGRASKNPIDYWYEGELGFFDFYIIPLAKKLRECGVFGVCSDEYLNYAEKNRIEWEERGQMIVAQMAEMAQNGELKESDMESAVPHVEQYTAE